LKGEAKALTGEKKKAFTAKPKTHIQINSPGVHHYAKLKYCGLI
jgi:hypothetical protein